MLSMQQRKQLNDKKTEIDQQIRAKKDAKLQGDIDAHAERDLDLDIDVLNGASKKIQTQLEMDALFELQTYRDYLHRYVKQYDSKFEYKKTTLTKAERVKEQIKQLKSALKGATDNFKAPLLLEKKDSDQGSIATHLAQHFQQLFQAQVGPEYKQPYVELTPEGIKFFWSSTEQAERFTQILFLHGFKGLTLIQTEDAMLVPHTYLKKLLLLAQFYPENINTLIADWYRKAHLNHATLVASEAEALEGSLSPKPLPITIKSSAIVDQGESQVVKVTLRAQLTDKKLDKKLDKKHDERQHIVWLIDNTGGEVWQDAYSNAEGEKLLFALRKLAKELDDDDLITIQPINDKTTAFRVLGKDLKKDLDRYFKIPFRHVGNSFNVVLPTTAVFVREDPRDLRISPQALAKTTFVMIMLSAPSLDSPDDVIAMMQESVGYQYPTSLEIPDYKEDTAVSFGVKGAPAGQGLMPTILPVIIADKKSSDVTYMRRLAHSLGAPLKVIDPKDIIKGLPSVLPVLNIVKDRVPECVVRLTYKNAKGQLEVINLEQFNLPNQHDRDIFFQVPKGATDLKLFVVMDDQMNASTSELKRVTDEAEQKKIIDRDVTGALCDLVLDYSVQERKIVREFKAATSLTTHDYTVGDDYLRALPTAPSSSLSSGEAKDAKKASELKLKQLQKDTLAQLKKLFDRTKTGSLQEELKDVASQINRRTLTTSSELLLSEATFTKDRYYENNLVKPPVITFAQEDLFKAIANEQHFLVDEMLAYWQQNGGLANVKKEGLSPLWAALQTYSGVLFNLGRLGPRAGEFNSKRKDRCQDLVQKIIPFTTDLCTPNNNGNSVLHFILLQLTSAVHYKEIFPAILQQALQNGQLEKLLSMKNRQDKTIETILLSEIKPNQPGVEYIQQFIEDIRRAREKAKKAEQKAEQKTTVIKEKEGPKEKEASAPVAVTMQTLINAIDAKDYKEAERQLTLKKDLINQNYTTAEHSATPLIYSLVKLSYSQEEKLTQFISSLIEDKNIDLTIQDKKNNTALHRAICFAQIDLSKKIIKAAAAQGKLNELLNKKNSFGETIFSNLYGTFPSGPVREDLLTFLFSQLQPAEVKDKQISDAKHILAKEILLRVPTINDAKEIDHMITRLWTDEFKSFRLPTGSSYTRFKEVHDGKEIGVTQSFSNILYALKLQKIKVELTAGTKTEKAADEALTALTVAYQKASSYLGVGGLKITLFGGSDKARSKQELLTVMQQENTEILKQYQQYQPS